MNGVGFEKLLSKTDCNQSSTHQSGILIPKTVDGLLEFLPSLDGGIKNPRELVRCVDESGDEWVFFLIYYNNRLHDDGGTRNEYRLTRTSGFLRARSASAGDYFQISKTSSESFYRINIRSEQYELPALIQLKGWRQIH